jgi:ferritin-like metal-binding protein YciE
MFEHFNTADEVFHYKLGLALTMEYDSLDMLGEMEKVALRSDVRDLFHDHAHETRQQIENLQQGFSLLGLEANQAPSRASKGLAKEARSFIATTDDTVLDGVLLGGGLELAHYETAVYEGLVIQAQAKGTAGIAELLNQNLSQEKAVIDKIKAAFELVAREDAAVQDESAAHPEPAIVIPPYLPPGSI